MAMNVLFYQRSFGLLREFLRITLRIPTAYDFRAVSACTYTTYKMVAFFKLLGLRETNHRFFLGSFLFSLNAEITFFLYSEYGQIYRPCTQ